jgi:2-C-methyl-D-erythritol 4-phosphate cytidylyltransferase
MNYWVVLPAAGRGERFGGPVPKQYEALPGGLVIEHALAPFLQSADGSLRGVVVALSAGDTRFAALPVAHHPQVSTTTGGASRAESVLAGLNAVRARGGAEDDWVLVHDAARPCLGAEELGALFAALATPAGQASGALLALPVADTVKRAAPRPTTATGKPEPAVVAATVPREGLWRALTPQAFRLGPLTAALENALRLAAAPAGMAPTDEAAAMEAMAEAMGDSMGDSMGEAMCSAPLLVPGSPYNVKVTLPADLDFAATVLRSREQRPHHD